MKQLAHPDHFPGMGSDNSFKELLSIIFGVYGKDSSRTREKFPKLFMLVGANPE